MASQEELIAGADLSLFQRGELYSLYHVLGAQLQTRDGVPGVRFALWAPNARQVSVIGDWNRWDAAAHPMRCLGDSGVWALFVPGLGVGEKYKFAVEAREGYWRIKSDPVAFYSELRPCTASIVASPDVHCWKDQAWQAGRGALQRQQTMRIYEVHLGSWRKNGSLFFNYRQLGAELARYARDMHFTHVEIMPVMEHPLDESWGYQVTGFFSVTSRYGTVEDFQCFVDILHQNNIGVILDWVPAHFPTDDFALNRFDGTCLYEHEDPRKGMHPHWHTAIFNYGRVEVANFLIASALFWIDRMHVDGIRVDAVASMLYLDYGRREGEWIPNAEGGRLNFEAISFLRRLNAAVHERFPGTFIIAEESSAYEGVTRSVEWGGLGFDFKWNMGWMNDTLRYFARDPVYRKFHQNDLTFSLLYAFSERFVLALSHDEAVHAKRSLLSKMPGPDWQKFANVRLLYSYMICHPGKKLLFMGGELGQWGEWNAMGQIDWELLRYPLHEGLQRCVRELNAFSEAHSALWERDFDWSGFEWIDFSDADRSIICYLRKSEKETLVCIHNFTPEVFCDYPIPWARGGIWKEVLNTDALCYGGSGREKEGAVRKDNLFLITVAPLATMIFAVEKEE